MKNVPGSEVSTSWFNESKKPPQSVLDQITDYMSRHPNPTYLGYISSEIGWSLGQTQEMLRELERRGLVRELNGPEKATFGFSTKANVWVIVK